MRNPPTTAVILARVPAPLRPQMFAAASALATLGGFVTLILTGPSLENLGVKPTFAMIATVSSLGTVLFVRSALRKQADEDGNRSALLPV